MTDRRFVRHEALRITTMLARDLERRFDARVVSLHVDGSGARVALSISPLASPAWRRLGAERVPTTSSG